MRTLYLFERESLRQGYVICFDSDIFLIYPRGFSRDFSFPFYKKLPPLSRGSGTVGFVFSIVLRNLSECGVHSDTSVKSFLSWTYTVDSFVDLETVESSSETVRTCGRREDTSSPPSRPSPYSVRGTRVCRPLVHVQFMFNFRVKGQGRLRRFFVETHWWYLRRSPRDFSSVRIPRNVYSRRNHESFSKHNVFLCLR